ncbi:MAG: hydrogenase maturation nickel metallochaperone HypA [Bacteroidales bacterium]|nr:hydrogenase maturation nickel metallochaperone HypA [Bacteroidales bacterium]
MHELSIAMSIVDIVLEEAAGHHAKRVSKVEIEIGSQAGIVYDALVFAMDEAVRDTLLEKAELAYHFIDAVSVCQECCHEFKPEFHYAACPLCNSFQTYVIQGKELKVKSIDIETID